MPDVARASALPVHRSRPPLHAPADPLHCCDVPVFYSNCHSATATARKVVSPILGSLSQIQSPGSKRLVRPELLGREGGYDASIAPVEWCDDRTLEELRSMMLISWCEFFDFNPKADTFLILYSKSQEGKLSKIWCP